MRFFFVLIAILAAMSLLRHLRILSVPFQPVTHGGMQFSSFSCVYAKASGDHMECRLRGERIFCESNRSALPDKPICHFQNVCFSGGSVAFFVNPSCNVVSTPPLTVTLGMDSQTMSIQPVFGARPSGWTYHNAKLGLITGHASNNVGHVILDEVLSIFVMFEQINLDLDDTIMIGTATVPQFRRPYTMLVSLSNIMSLAELEGQCFSHVVAGAAQWSYAAAGLSKTSPTLHRFRNHVLARLNIHPHVRLKFSVLFVLKDADAAEHKSTWTNIEAIVTNVKARFPTWVVHTVMWTRLPSFHDQINLVHRTHVLVSLPGSDVVNGLFLQDGSAIIMPCRHMGDKFESSNEVPHLFNYMGWVKTFQFCGQPVQHGNPSAVLVDESFLMSLLEHLAKTLPG